MIPHFFRARSERFSTQPNHGFMEPKNGIMEPKNGIMQPKNGIMEPKNMDSWAHFGQVFQWLIHLLLVSCEHRINKQTNMDHSSLLKHVAVSFTHFSCEIPSVGKKYGGNFQRMAVDPWFQASPKQN